MNISAKEVMVFIDLSSEYYCEDSIWKEFALVTIYSKKEIYIKICRARISIPISHVCF